MTYSYMPFDTGAGANVTEDQWRKMAKLWRSDGVIRGDLNEFATFADSTGMQVKVPSGRSWINGHWFESDAQVTLAIAAAHATLGRLDTVVIRQDYTANTIALAVVTGTASASPVAPTLTQTSALYEFPLADITVAAAASTLAAGTVTDRRIFSGARIAVRAYRTAVQSIPNNTSTAIQWTAESFDSHAMHDNAVNNTRFTVPAGGSGKYSVSARVPIAANATGQRQLVLIKNGAATRLGFDNAPGSAALETSLKFATTIDLAPGDYLEITVLQDSGGALNTGGVGAGETYVDIYRIDGN